MNGFIERSHSLPFLGIGVSTEYGAYHGDSLDIFDLAARFPEFAGFLEIGLEVEKGLDTVAQSWIEQGRPTTYHFLDINLDDPADFDAYWLDQVREHIAAMKPSWLCGDAGLWHFGRRERGHMLLLPPVLSDDSARRFADGIIMLREQTGCEVLPENPPGHVFLGDLHLLDFFAQVCERADTGMLLDAAHLAIYQRTLGYEATTGLDGFPADKIVELHIAGATTIDVDGLAIVEDDHTVDVLPDTWHILERVAPIAPTLKAIVFECERNTLERCLPGFTTILNTVKGSPFGDRLGAL